MNIVIVGAGAQGAPCTSILAKQPGVKRILLGAMKESTAVSVRDRLGSDEVIAARLDSRDEAGMLATIRKLLGKVDFVVDLTPSFCSQPIMRVALALNANYLNTAACPEHLDQLIKLKPLDLDDEFKKAGRSAVLGMGASPGAVNVLCRHFCDGLEMVERIEIRAGFHVPAQREMIKTWIPTWCPEQQYFDFCDPPCLFHDGRHEHMEQFFEPEEYDFGGNLSPSTSNSPTNHNRSKQWVR